MYIVYKRYLGHYLFRMKTNFRLCFFILFNSFSMMPIYWEWVPTVYICPAMEMIRTVRSDIILYGVKNYLEFNGISLLFFKDLSWWHINPCTICRISLMSKMIWMVCKMFVAIHTICLNQTISLAYAVVGSIWQASIFIIHHPPIME